MGRNRGVRILSLFDGGSGGNIAAWCLGWLIEKYYASEIDKAAITQTQASFPATIQLGKVQRLRAYLQAGIEKLSKIAASHPRYDLAQYCIDILENGIDLLIGGSPCQGFSFAGKQLDFKDPRSVLFFEYVKIRELVQPKYFFLENVKMKTKVEAEITRIIGLEPIRINTALVSAQNRRRLYWTNFRTRQIDLFGTLAPEIAQPKDRKLYLRDILQPESEVDSKYYLSETQQKKLRTKGFKGLNLDAKAKTLRVGGWNTPTAKHNIDAIKVDRHGKLKNDQDKASTLTPGGKKAGGNHSDMDIIAVKNHNGELDVIEKAQCLDANYSKGPDNHGQRSYICVAQVGRRVNPETGKREDNNKAIPCEQRIEPAPAGKTNCLTTVEKDNLILITDQAIVQRGRGKNEGGVHSEKAPTLTANAYEQNNYLYENYRLRRLTPRECMRLQGWPEWIKQHVADTRMYEILGNGWQNDVIVYLFSHIKESEQWKKQSKSTPANGGIGRTGSAA